ncbi:hypothetical protein QBC37DRAFT_420430 [Rhypophila decipiens]|uniref:Uncharacterized protein n=1 Tax=Rhypophila decipiens TaxID=261697 RepID=A0AAN6Y8S4_9PEZI|nr:hypothetical protein QBC37DRAFT_420430 [Rhypophila decipiens]
MLLGRLAQIEEFLADVPAGHPPPIDFILAAETDLQNLKDRIFTCQGHTTAATITFTNATSTSSFSSCLSTSRPVFLILSLLAERVIHLFEELFRHANALIDASGDHTQFASSNFGFHDPGVASSTTVLCVPSLRPTGGCTSDGSA